MDILRLGRFHFLFGGFLIYSLGALIAVHFGSDWDLRVFLFGYMVFAPAHLSVSYSNDVYDMKADSHNIPTPFSGGSGVLQRRPELAPVAKWIAISLIAISIMLSIVFMVIYNRSILFPLFVVLGCLLGWAYTGPPFRLAYRRLGEVSTVTAVGLLVLFMGFYVMSGELDNIILFFLVPQLFYGVEFIMNVQIPDREADILGKKTTFVVLYGRKISFMMVMTAVTAATLFYGAIYFLRIGPVFREMGYMALLSLIPLTIALPSTIIRPTSKKKASIFAVLNMASMFAFLISAMILFILI